MPYIDKGKRAEYAIKRYQRLRLHFVQLLGGKCNNCGSTVDLEFDHIDPKTKEFSVSRILTHEKVLEEIKKCQLLCKECHEEKTRDEFGRATHSTIGMYRHHKCRCDKCKQVWNLKTKEWKKHSRVDQR